VTRFDARSGQRQASVEVGNDPSSIASGAGSVWVANRSDGTVTRIDPATRLTTTIPVGHGPAALVVNGAGAWVANAGSDTLAHIDLGTNAVTSTTQIGNGTAALLATPDALWVANSGDGTVQKLDPRSGALRKTIHLGGSPNAMTMAGGEIWVALAPALPAAPATGGVARITVQDNLASIDPALGPAVGTQQISYVLCANLVTYPDSRPPLVHRSSRRSPKQSLRRPTGAARTRSPCVPDTCSRRPQTRRSLHRRSSRRSSASSIRG
jgi:YVTN family beta-propeller protein